MTRVSSRLLALAFRWAPVIFFAASVTAANFSVTNGNDSGAGSLRQAIADAEAAAGADTITIDTTAAHHSRGNAARREQRGRDHRQPFDRRSPAGLSRVFKVTSSGAGCVRLRGLQITGGVPVTAAAEFLSSSACLLVRRLRPHRRIARGRAAASARLELTFPWSIRRSITTKRRGNWAAGSMRRPPPSPCCNATIAENSRSHERRRNGILRPAQRSPSRTALSLTTWPIPTIAAPAMAGASSLFEQATVTIKNTAVTGNRIRREQRLRHDPSRISAAPGDRHARTKLHRTKRRSRAESSPRVTECRTAITLAPARARSRLS